MFCNHSLFPDEKKVLHPCRMFKLTQDMKETRPKIKVTLCDGNYVLLSVEIHVIFNKWKVKGGSAKELKESFSWLNYKPLILVP